MTNDTIKISVIVPVYNVERYLAQCLDSILNQDFQDFEVICVNDGTTDSSGDLLEEYAQKDGRIVIINQTNQGLSAARNTGMKNAKGKYISFVDSDDMIDITALGKLYRCAEDNNAEIVTFETKPLLYETEALRDKGKDKYYRVDGEYAGVKKGSEFYCEMVENGDYVESAWLVFAQKKFLEEKGISFEVGRYFEDGKFSQDCYFLSSRMVHLGEQLYFYRVRGNSIMTEAYTSKHVVDRMWQLDEVLKEIYTGNHSDREVNALSKYATQVAMSMCYASSKLPLRELEKLGALHGINDFFAKTYYLVGRCIVDPEMSLISTIMGFLGMVSNYKTVVIYGAGTVGKRIKFLLDLFEEQGHVTGFATSDEPEQKYIEGLGVRRIDQYESDSSTLLIMAVGQKYEVEMVENAKKNGFENIYILPGEIRSFLKKCETVRQVELVGCSNLEKIKKINSLT